MRAGALDQLIHRELALRIPFGWLSALWVFAGLVLLVNVMAWAA